MTTSPPSIDWPASAPDIRDPSAGSAGKPGFTRCVLLAGGVGGARMAEGLARALPEGALTVIANVGDDERFYGLHVSPDIDTLIYTLADRIDRKQGWGVADDTVNALGVLSDLGAPVWMKLGDADFGLHIWRSWRLAQGASLTEVTREAASRLGARAMVIPATDDPLQTKLRTDDGWMDFQPWFVGRRCEPKVGAIRYEGASDARPSPAALDAIAAAELIVVAPSNPLLSIDPILAIPGIRDAVLKSAAPRIGVSPLIGGKAVKGPLGRLIDDLGLLPGAAGVAARYGELLDGFVVDPRDMEDAEGSAKCIFGVDIMLSDPEKAEAVARSVLGFARQLRPSTDGMAL